MSDTTLNATESGMLADIRLHDIVVGVDVPTNPSPHYAGR